jgi:hypothetical protein
MATKKTVTTAAAGAVTAEVAAAKKPAEKKPAAKKAAKKPAAKKPAAKKTAAAKKPAAKKAATAKKTATKKPAAKKATAAAEYIVEFQDRQLAFKDLDKKVAKQLKAAGAEAAKKVAVYVKPEENAAYIVADGEPKGSVALYE